MKRALASVLLKRLRDFPCVAIIGPRQSGKTTLVKDVLKNWAFYDLEKRADLAAVEIDPDLFLENNSDKVCIDEAQFCPDLFPALRVAIDRDRKKKGRFVITGSSSPALLSNISESLAGRVCILELTPFSNAEIKRERTSLVDWLIGDLKMPLASKSSVNKTKIFDKWFWGSFPEPLLSKGNKFKNLWLENYVKNYIERDVRMLFPRINMQTFRRFINILGNVSGQILNLSDISRSLAISQPTVREYIEIIEGTFLWHTVLPYEQNVIKRISKHPKGYLLDSGLIHHFLFLPSIKALQGHPALGRSWESFVFAELRKGFLNAGVDAKFFYYRTAGGSEIDFLIKTKKHLFAFEVKFSSVVEPRDLRSIKEFMKNHDLKAGFIICNADRVERLGENIFQIPSTLL